MKRSVVAIIMAGGLGKRMLTNVPKVLHKLGGIPMINRIVVTLKQLSYHTKLVKVIVVVGKYKNEIKQSIDLLENLPNISYVTQDEPLGTGHAIMCCEKELTKYKDSDVLILSGDVPLLGVHTIKELLSLKTDIKLITTKLEDPRGYGRIITQHGLFVKIVEQKDCDINQMCEKTINGGIYCITSHLLCKYLKELNNNNSQNEYYLTDIIEIIKNNENIDVAMLCIPSEFRYEIMGVNTVDQLKELDGILKNKIEYENKVKTNCIKP
jgi:UDP-N-acetylglucosamine diphosphorylase/glucosamine-1-phosphate N-acetyltransferase